MKYVPPLREAEDASYVNFDPAHGVDGSKVPAEAIEHPMREIVNAIKALGLDPDERELNQLALILLALKENLGTKVKECTREEWDALPDSKFSDGIIYLIISPGGGGQSDN